MILSNQHVSKQEKHCKVPTSTMRIKEKKNLFDTRKKKKLYEHILHVPTLRC